MAEVPPSLLVLLSDAAQDDLLGIWADNVDRHGLERAESYEDFLKVGINSLANRFPSATSIEGFPHVRCMTFRKRPRAYGHHVIFRVDDENGLILVLRIFHTSMDVVARLSEGSR